MPDLHAKLRRQKPEQPRRVQDENDEEQFIKQLPQLKSAVNTFDMTWELTFEPSEDMRSTVFDFAQSHGLKILELNTVNKNLESLFRELTV